MKVKESFDLYLRDVIQYRNQSRRTEEHHHTAEKSLLSYCGPDILLEELTFEKIRAWKNYLETHGYAVGTIYGYVVRLRCVLAYMRKKGFVCVDIEEIKPPQRLRKRTPGFLSEDEVSTLINLAAATRGSRRAKRNAAIVALIYSSGIRVGEVVNMNITDAHYDTFVAQGKGGKDRPCFIDPRARYYLDEYLKCRTDNNPALFICDLTGKRISIDVVQMIMRNLKNKAGIQKKITPHVLRHSFATNFVRNNGNIRHLQAMLGHESLETTQIYTHVVDQDLARAHQQFHSIETPELPDLPQVAWRPTEKVA